MQTAILYFKLQFKLSVGIIGIIYLAQSVGYSSGTIIAGQITDRLVRIWMILDSLSSRLDV